MSAGQSFSLGVKMVVCLSTCSPAAGVLGGCGWNLWDERRGCLTW